MKQYSILLVDDNATSLKLLKAIYEADYEVLTATDGLEALEVLLQNKVDLVVSDVLMPNMDGYYLCYKIRTNPKLKNIPVIIYTATYTSISEEKIAKEMGATLFIRKPAAIYILTRATKDILQSPERYPHSIPTRPGSAEIMQNYSQKLIAKLELNNIELEEIKAKLELSEEKLKKAQSIAHIGHWELDFATGVGLWSEEACRIYGLHPADNKQTFDNWISFIHPDDLDFVTELIKASKQSLKGDSFDHRIVRKDGTIRHIHTESKFEFESNSKPVGLYGIAQDITEKKEAELKLQQAHSRLVFHIENSPLGFIEWDDHFRVKSVSKQAVEIFGWSEEYMKGQKDGYDMIYHEDLQGVSKIGAQLLSAEVERNCVQNRNYTKDGRVIWCEWFNSVMKDADGKVDTVLSLVQDITKRKEAENEIKELNENLEKRIQERTAELTEANKALEGFSYSVSHDLKAPVRAVIGFSKIIQQDYAGTMEPEMQELFTHIEDSGKRMNAIINDLLKLAKYGKENLKTELVNMRRLVNGVWLNISRSTPHCASLELATLPDIEVDMSMMQQVVVNLLSNAIKYSSKTHQPVVSVWCEPTTDNIIFYFKDNGAGFDMKNYDRLFGTFQRLHNIRDFEGTGVGLSLVKRIIEKHGGTVGADAKVGEGATFWFSLPKSPIEQRAI